jgi:hypothetical protein
VRIGTKADVKKVLLVELEPVKEAMGLAENLEATLDVLVGALDAKYDLTAHEVLVIPGNVEELTRLFARPAMASEDALRAVLAHECVHAFDFPRHGWLAKRNARTSPDAQKAFGAVVEGHAQLVAKRICAAQGITPAFDEFTRMITAIPAGLSPMQTAIARAVVAEAEFGYVQGAAFLEAVLAARGEAGLLAVLAEPPTDPRHVEHPAEFLAPTAVVAGLPLPPFFAAFDAATPGAEWKRTSQSILEGSLRAQLADLPEVQRRAALAGFLEGRVSAGNRAGGESVAVLLVARFRSPEDALAFVAADVAVMRQRDEKMKTGAVRIESSTYEEGLGSKGAVAGTRARKVVAALGKQVVLFTSIFAVGAYAFEMTFSNVGEVPRASLYVLVDGLARHVTDPAHPAPSLPEGFALVPAAAPTPSEPVPAK